MSTTGSEAPHPLQPGGAFRLAGKPYLLHRYIDLTHVLARRETDGELLRVAVAEVLDSLQQEVAEARRSSTQEGIPARGAERLSDEKWAIAEARARDLDELERQGRTTREAVGRVAKKYDVDIATVYAWRERYREAGFDPAVLAPYSPSGGRGKPRIDQIANAILEAVLKEKWFNEQKLKITKIMPILRSRCQRAGVKLPHVNTVRRRVSAFPLAEQIRAREGREAGRKYEPKPGRFPGGEHPNDVWQVDHTPLDICIVDDEGREHIGRIWITLIIDVCSRCVVGFYISMDPPSEVAVGMAIVHAILPKEGWLAAHGMSVSWPMRGRPVVIHADNDKTFKCKTITRACSTYGIRMEWRPVRTPEWGGHIERLCGTLNEQIHTLPGTTFSNPLKRGKYKPHKTASLPFDAIEANVVDFLCGIYHNDFHSSIKRPPIARYEAGLLGDGTNKGIGLPPPENDPERLRLDFLPQEERTVQQSGVTIDLFTYYHPCMDRWIKALDPDNPKKHRLFTCRRDPRDLSEMWFHDPEIDTYFKVPLRDISHPAISIWELREIRKELVAAGRGEVNEQVIFETWERMEARNQAEVAVTQKARRDKQRKKVNAKKIKAETAQVEAAKSGYVPKPAANDLDGVNWDEPVVPYGVLDD